MKLYVGNLPYSVDSHGLRQVFEDAGFQVDNATVLEDRMTNRSRGFGFVETPEGDAAIEKIGAMSLEGRSLQVNEARPQAPRNGFGGRRDRY
jgi:RNA recognition motif-containing protein